MRSVLVRLSAILLLAVTVQVQAGDFQALFERHVGYSMLKQYTLRDIVSGGRWSVNLNNMKIYFSNGVSADIQLLGTESYVSNTWLWSWANYQAALPGRLLKDALELRRYGVENSVDSFTTASFNLKRADGFQLAFIASGLLHRPGFYKGPYTDGAAYFLLTNIPGMSKVNADGLRIIRSMTDITKLFSVNHRNVMHHLMLKLGNKPCVYKRMTEYQLASGQTIKVWYDKLDRIKNILLVAGKKIRYSALCRN